MKPLNARLLVRVNTSEYKHITINSDKLHEQGGSSGVVIAVAADADDVVKELHFHGKEIKGTILPSLLVGKTVRWERHAEKNSLIDLVDSKTKEKYKASLIDYKDIIGYED